MELGMIGLGRMGNNMVRRLLQTGHRCVVYDIHPEAVQALIKEKAVGATSLDDFVHKLAKPRAIWMMVPAAAVDPTLKDLVPLLEHGDVVIDGGNSYYHDDIRRAAELEPKGIHYVDVGTSGGVWGMERGYCLMIGGDEAAVRHLDPIFAALAPGIEAAPRTLGREKVRGTAEHGYLRCGPAGAGHFVKMVHNGIEYGAMIETPSAVILAQHLAPHVNFFSIGTNDLVQYLLTTDRTSSEMAPYYEPLHPAVLQALSSLATTAREGGRDISICGEMAGNPAYTALLLGLNDRAR